MDVDVAGYRRLVAGRNIQLQPCFHDHHATDGYRFPPIELFRGVFGNWWQQGADSVATFNWSNAPPQRCRKVGAEPGPLSQQEAYHEVGSPQTLRRKDKIFAVERRGGYPWAEGFFNRNDTAPLPARLSDKRSAVKCLTVQICDDVAADACQVRQLRLCCVLFAGAIGSSLRCAGTASRLARPNATRHGRTRRFSRPLHNPLRVVRGTIASIRLNACCASSFRSTHACARWARIASRCGLPAIRANHRPIGSPWRNWKSTCTIARPISLDNAAFDRLVTTGVTRLYCVEGEHLLGGDAHRSPVDPVLCLPCVDGWHSRPRLWRRFTQPRAAVPHKIAASCVSPCWTDR